MKQPERLLAGPIVSTTQARCFAVERIAQAALAAEVVTHLVELRGVRDRARSTDHAPNLTRSGIDKDRRAGAVVEIGWGALAVTSSWQGVHLLLLRLGVVPVAPLGDLDHEIGRRHSS